MTMTYALMHGSTVARSDGAIIPADPANSDYVAFLAWVAAGNAAAAAPAKSLALQAQEMLEAGVEVGATGALTFTATFDTGSDSRIDLLGNEAALLKSGGTTLLSGSSSITWHDVAGNGHTLTAAQFPAFATPIGLWIDTLRSIVKSGSGTLPAISIPIAF